MSMESGVKVSGALQRNNAAAFSYNWRSWWPVFRQDGMWWTKKFYLTFHQQWGPADNGWISIPVPLRFDLHDVVRVVLLSCSTISLKREVSLNFVVMQQTQLNWTWHFFLQFTKVIVCNLQGILWRAIYHWNTVCAHMPCRINQHCTQYPIIQVPKLIWRQKNQVNTESKISIQYNIFYIMAVLQQLWSVTFWRMQYICLAVGHLDICK